jgi:hypothetical protein
LIEVKTITYLKVAPCDLCQLSLQKTMENKGRFNSNCIGVRGVTELSKKVKTEAKTDRESRRKRAGKEAAGML